MKIPKQVYIPCINRCPKVSSCFFVSTHEQGKQCTLAYYSQHRVGLDSLIKILEIESEERPSDVN